MISGSVISRNVCQGVAPRSCAASSSDRSNPISRDRTVTITNDRLNIMCAITIVVKPVATLEVEEHRQQRGAEHDLGRGERDEDEEVDRRAAAELVAHQRQRGDRAERRRDQRRQRGDLERDAQRVADAGHAERVLPGVERELLPDEVEAPLRLVEREEQDDRDRQQQVEQREPGVEVQPARRAACRRAGGCAARGSRRRW